MPDGTPKKQVPRDLKSAARAYTDVALKSLVGIALNGTQEGAVVSASIALLDRGWGRPNQPHDANVSGAIEIVMRNIAAEKASKK